MAELVDIEGSWKAGRDRAKAGILIPVEPEIGDVFRSEVLYDEAEDILTVLSLTGDETTVVASCNNLCLVTKDHTPLEPGDEENKYYLPGTGLILEVDLETGDRTELVSFGNAPYGPVLADAKLLIEHNSTDEDTGFQGFGDADPYNSLSITDPQGVVIVTVTALGGFRDFGLTELFFETSEPENAEVPIDDIVERLVEGTYTFTGDLVEDGSASLTTVFSHDIPAGPELISPQADAEGVDPTNTVISWSLVTSDLDDDEIIEKQC